DRLPFHHGLARQRADVTQAENSGAVGDNGNEITASGVFKGVMGIFVDGETRLSDAGRVGQTEIALCPAGLGGGDFNFSRLGTAVIIQSLLLGNHCFLSDFFVTLPRPRFPVAGSIPSDSGAIRERSDSSGERLS